MMSTWSLMEGNAGKTQIQSVGCLLWVRTIKLSGTKIVFVVFYRVSESLNYRRYQIHSGGEHFYIIVT